MEIYTTLFIIYLILSLNNKKYFANQNKYFLFCSGLLLFLFFFRSKYVGADTPNYVIFSLNIPGYYGTWQHPNFSDIQPGLIWFCKFVRVFSQNEQFFLIVYACAVLLPFLYLVRKHSNHCVFSLLSIFVLKSPVSALLAAVRQSLSLGFLMLAIICYEREIKHKGIIVPIFLILSISFHSTTIAILILLIILYFLKIPKSIAYLCVIFSAIYGLLWGENTGEYIDLFISHLTSEGFTEMGTYSSNDLMGNMLFVQIVPFSLMCIFSFLMMNKDEYSSIFSKCLLVSCIFFNIFNNSNSIIRIALAFQLLGYIAIVPKVVKTNAKIYNLFLIFFIYFSWRTLVNYYSRDFSIIGNNFWWMWEK